MMSYALWLAGFMLHLIFKSIRVFEKQLNLSKAVIKIKATGNFSFNHNLMGINIITS